MPQEPEEESGIARKDFFIVFFLLFNALIWWFVMQIIIEDTLFVLGASDPQIIVVLSSFFAAIVASSIVGSILSKRIRRLRFIYAWTVLGAGISFLPALFSISSVIHLLSLSVLFGASFGLGMPSCLAFFADWTRVESRGRKSGILLLITNLSAPLFVIMFGTLDLVTSSVILAAWRGFGLIVLLLKPEENEIVSEKKKIPSFSSIIHNRTFVLYFVAWFMFCLIDRFETPIQKNFHGDSYNLVAIVGPLLGGISAFVGGLLADRIGRKRVALYAFVSLGIAYALIGITAAPVVAWFLSFSVIAISAGIMWVLFIMILWGDLSKFVTSEKYYAIGIIPFFITNIVQLFSAEYFTDIPVTSAFSLAAFFLFVAVLPLLYAPETLPEKKIELRRLRSFAEDAKKAKEKYERKLDD